MQSERERGALELCRYVSQPSAPDGLADDAGTVLRGRARVQRGGRRPSASGIVMRESGPVEGRPGEPASRDHTVLGAPHVDVSSRSARRGRNTSLG